MAELVTLEEVDLALRLNLEADDDRIPDVEAKMDQAEDAVLDYLKAEELPDHPRVRAAIMLLIRSLYDDEAADLVTGLGTGDPRNPVVALLYRLRDPALA